MDSVYLIVINPQSGSRGEHYLEQICQRLKQSAIQYHVVSTTEDQQQTINIINQELEKITQVIVIGGDGTLHTMANVLAKSNIPLGIIPCGTGNDFCKNIYRPGDDIIETALFGDTRQVDLGWCNDIYFMNVLGIGYDGMIAKSTSGKKNGPFRSLVYLWSALKYLPLYKERPMQLVSAGINKHEPTFLAAFANGAFFANGMKVAPLAKITDGQLDCCWIGKMNLLKKVFRLLKIFSGRHINETGIEYVKGEKFEVPTAGLPVEADGEYIGQTPASIRIEKNALLLKVP